MNNPNTPQPEPLENALEWGRIVCRLGDNETSVFLHYDHGDRNFPIALNIATWVKIGLATYFLPRSFPSEFGAMGMQYYALAYFVAFNLHRIHRLTRKEEDLPRTRYDGTPWLQDIIPYKEFSRDKYPMWFPDDTEVLLKLTLEPVLVFAAAYFMYDSIGDKALSAYLVFNAFSTFISKMLTRAKEMDKKYDRIDAENEARAEQARLEGKKPRNKGFGRLANLRPAQDTKTQLSEDALNAKIEDLALKALKNRQAQPQAPIAANEEDAAIGTKKASSQTSTRPRPTIQRFQIDEEEDSTSSTDGITVFSELPRTEPALSSPAISKTNSNGAAKLTPKVMKPPISKTYKERLG